MSLQYLATVSGNVGATSQQFSNVSRIGQQLLPSMKYKGFTWPNNPATCKYSVKKAYAEHKYPELTGAEIEDMDPNAVILTGEGEFFGPNAYQYWNELNAVFNEHGVGDFYHPVYTDISKALLVELSSDLEPRQDYVKYSFTFIVHDIIPWVHTTMPDDTINGNSDNSVYDGVTNRTIAVGDVVICNGYAYYDSYGSTPRSAKMVNKTMVVTYTNYKGSHPIHVGSIGWMRLQDVSLGKTSATPNKSSSSQYSTYVVKAGDTLSGIATRYGTTWKVLAEYNSIKNPNLIYVGDVIKIPK